MNCRRYRLIGLLFVFFAVFLYGEKAYCTSNTGKNRNSSSFNLKTSHNNYWNVISGGESSQLLVPQLYKTVHFIKGAFMAPKSFVLCLKFLNFFSGGGKKGQPNSQKLLLFPFHVFW
jgi:hypothetical protein